jgi:hypothetical protein
MSATATTSNVRQPPAAGHESGSKRQPTRSAAANSSAFRYPDREKTRSMSAAATMVGTPSGNSTMVRTSPRSGKRAWRASATAAPTPSWSANDRSATASVFQNARRKTSAAAIAR